MAEPLFFRRPRVKRTKRRKCPTPGLVGYRRQAAKAALRRLKRQRRSGIAPAHDRHAVSRCTCGLWHLIPRRVVNAAADA